MLLLSNELDFLRRLSECGDGIQIRATNAFTAQLFCRHRLARQSGDRLVISDFGRQLLASQIAKPERQRTYVEFSETVA